MSALRDLWKAAIGLMLAVMSTSVAAQTVEYIHTDALGTPVAVTNSVGVVIERSEYEPYGALLNRPITDGPGFTGHVQDAATGLTYMQQRYYDPGIGRFLSVDPVQANPNTGASFNRYVYANNNPYKFIDPDGRATENAFWNGDQLFYNAGENFNIKGTYTFAGHGDAGLVQIDKSAKQVRGLTFDQAYAHMQKTGLQLGQDAFSISCRFGMVGRDGQIMAQQVADKNGSNVYGADGWVNYDKKGDTTTLTVWSGRDKTGDQGAFQLFTPGGKGPASGAAIKSVSINSKSGEVKLEPIRREAPTGSHIKR